MTMGAGVGDTAGFPIADVLAKPLRTIEVAAAMARLPPPPGRPTRVMVIDDDPVALDLMRATLAAIGIEVLGHLQGRQALQQIDSQQPDAIVLDLMMPEFDGFAVLDALRRLPAWCNTPVFVWTSMLLTDEEYVRLSRSARAILDKGGGAIAELLAALRHGSPAATRPGVAP
jgi:CheY-like chemotaxis protein